ncbi:MAG: arginase family protein [Crocinitomicaceae bacterium]
MKTATSKTGLFSFYLADSSWQSKNTRLGEEKLAQKIHFGTNSTGCRYVIIGISEDIGPQMNGGLPGSNKGFQSFCSAFQNIQSNRFLKGDEVGILGEIKQNQPFESIVKCANWVEELDDFILHVLGEFCPENQVIITIGGGHNNAYPLLKHTKQTRRQSLTSINIDPHADCRKTDYRHSGNPFSFAIQEKTIDRYRIFGLHESYNNEYILDFIQQHEIEASYFEEFLDNENAFWEQLTEFTESCPTNSSYALDIDLDAIAFQPSSAISPSGFQIEEIRKMIRILAGSLPISSFHLPEGAPKTAEEEKAFGKMVSYFVSDFIKQQNKLNK